MSNCWGGVGVRGVGLGLVGRVLVRKGAEGGEREGKVGLVELESVFVEDKIQGG